MEGIESVKKVLEGALLAAGRPLTSEDLAALFLPEEARQEENQEAYAPLRNELKKQIRKAVAEMQKDCAERAVDLVEVSSGYRYQIKQDIAGQVAHLWATRPQRMSRAMMETLALIAYRQPITRGDIEKIRGVSVNTQIVKTLLEFGWVRIVGYKDTPGRPMLLGTTKTFLDTFSLRSLEELPPLAELHDIAHLQAKGLLNDEQVQMVAKAEEEAKAAEAASAETPANEAESPVEATESPVAKPEEGNPATTESRDSGSDAELDSHRIEPVTETQDQPPPMVENDPSAINETQALATEEREEDSEHLAMPTETEAETTAATVEEQDNAEASVLPEPSLSTNPETTLPAAETDAGRGL